MPQFRSLRDSRLVRRVFVFLLAAAFTVVLVLRTINVNKYGVEDTLNAIPWPWGPKSTLIFKEEHLRQIWTWEISNGHYPSRAPLPKQLKLAEEIENPGIPSHGNSSTRGTGLVRNYWTPMYSTEHTMAAYPPRPAPGSAADLDIVMNHCDFSKNKYVSDCLEVLSVGAALDAGNRVRTITPEGWRYIYSHSSPSLSSCNPSSPHILHFFWSGPFTDKPYLAILSFLYTQNTGLHLQKAPSDQACRPELWMWIDAPSVANMTSQLEGNPWASPLLHARFAHLIKFKVWKTEEQLDALPELRDSWRDVSSNILSNGKPVEGKGAAALSTIQSDLVRFVVCHRFGGIYLDTDTILLRDWEDMWGWKGAYAYRWSRMPRYNTAVLHMNKGSALGAFIFRTALKNGFDFHPFTVTRYLEDAHLEGLLLQLPSALFDSAWLDIEMFQHDRPPVPSFKAFSDFFEIPADLSALPRMTGFDGFFKGAYSYHFHNFWWKPFDPAHNYPQLGPSFLPKTGKREDFQEQDIGWGAVMKRTFEAYLRGERPNMYGEWLQW